MIIRCERCSTLYELDESLLEPAGSEVQCTKCQHIFVARPPRPPEPADLVEPGAATTPAPTAATNRGQAQAQAAEEVRPSPTPPPTPRSEPRAVRTTAPQVYRPPTIGAPAVSVPRSPVLKRDTVGTFEARLRWGARWKWLAPVILAAVLAAAGGIWALSMRRSDVGTDRSREEALSLLALDDAASVDEAVSRLAAMVMKRPKMRAAAADRALALAIRAAAVSEEIEALQARAAAVRQDRERARREVAPGWEAAERSAAAEVTAVEAQIRVREEGFRALSSGAREQLVVLQSEAGETTEVLRGLAVLYAVTQERDRLERIVRSSRENGLRDSWIDLADGWIDSRDPDRAIRERGLVKLGTLAVAHPNLIRGRYLLARVQASLGRRGEAAATLDGVLAANPKHERAQRFRDQLTASPPVPVAAPPPPVIETPPPGKPAARMRKSVPHPSTDDSEAAPASAPDGESGQAASEAGSPAAAAGEAADPPAAPPAPGSQPAPPGAGSEPKGPPAPPSPPSTPFSSPRRNP